MPSFSTQVPHPLDQQSAVEKLTGLLVALQTKYKDVASDVQGTWADNVLNFSLKVMGFKITGKVTVQDKLATVEGQIPMAAAMFRGRIEESIKSELQKELST
jgi:putative polyhydroxyalkanoic acid system protein